MSSTTASPVILLADDAASRRERITDTLTLRGFTVIQTATWITTLQVADQIRPDLVAIHLRMPICNGLGVAGKLRNEKKFTNPIVVLCGDTNYMLPTGLVVEMFNLPVPQGPHDYEPLAERIAALLTTEPRAKVEPVS